MYNVSAPAGGIVVRGVRYEGGERIPYGPVEKASYDQYHQIEVARGPRKRRQLSRRADGSYEPPDARETLTRDDRPHLRQMAKTPGMDEPGLDLPRQEEQIGRSVMANAKLNSLARAVHNVEPDAHYHLLEYLTDHGVDPAAATWYVEQLHDVDNPPSYKNAVLNKIQSSLRELGHSQIREPTRKPPLIDPLEGPNPKDVIRNARKPEYDPYGNKYTDISKEDEGRRVLLSLARSIHEGDTTAGGMLNDWLQERGWHEREARDLVNHIADPRITPRQKNHALWDAQERLEAAGHLSPYQEATDEEPEKYSRIEVGHAAPDPQPSSRRPKTSSASGKTKMARDKGDPVSPLGSGVHNEAGEPTDRISNGAWHFLTYVHRDDSAYDDLIGLHEHLRQHHPQLSHLSHAALAEDDGVAAGVLADALEEGDISTPAHWSRLRELHNHLRRYQP